MAILAEPRRKTYVIIYVLIFSQCLVQYKTQKQMGLPKNILEENRWKHIYWRYHYEKQYL